MGLKISEEDRKRISAWAEAHRNEMLEDISILCRINSERKPYETGMPYGRGAAEALRRALRMAEDYGFSTKNYNNYAGAADMSTTLPKRLDILAHLDVVPAGGGWSITKPFEPVVVDGRIYGRGTADDKGPAVAALYAMRCVKEMGAPLAGNVRLILGTDEECGSSDIRYYYNIEEEAPMTFSPDANYPVTNVEKGRLPAYFSKTFVGGSGTPGIRSFRAGSRENVVPDTAVAVIEGLDDNLVREMASAVTEKTGVAFEVKGRGNTLEISAKGCTAHAMKPQEGRNALTAMILLLSELPLAESEQVEALRTIARLIPHGETDGKSLGIAMADELCGPLTLAFSIAEMDESSIRCCFDARVPAVGSDENVVEPLRHVLAENGFTLETEHMIPPHVVDGDSEFVRALNRAFEAVTGLPGGCESTGGGTYVHDLKNGVAFGAAMPGVDNRMHGADEFAIVQDLVDSVKIFSIAILELCGA